MYQDEEQHRRFRDERDGDEDIKATVRLARSFIEKGLMTRPEALKYFNLPEEIYDKYNSEVPGN